MVYVRCQRLIGGIGPEAPPRKRWAFQQGGAKSVETGAVEQDSEVQLILASWRTLAKAMRKAVLRPARLPLQIREAGLPILALQKIF